VKSAQQQADLLVLRMREMAVGQRTQLVNALRGHATEFCEPLLGGVAIHLAQKAAWYNTTSVLHHFHKIKQKYNTIHT
jgi:transposase